MSLGIIILYASDYSSASQVGHNVNKSGKSFELGMLLTSLHSRSPLGPDSGSRVKTHLYHKFTWLKRPHGNYKAYILFDM